MEVTVPANTIATIYVPAKDAACVAESGPLVGLLRQSSGQVRAGKPAGEAEGVTFLRMENNVAVYAVGSGTYRFESVMGLICDNVK